MSPRLWARCRRRSWVRTSPLSRRASTTSLTSSRASPSCRTPSRASASWAHPTVVRDAAVSSADQRRRALCQLVVVGREPPARSPSTRAGHPPRAGWRACRAGRRAPRRGPRASRPCTRRPAAQPAATAPQSARSSPVPGASNDRRRASATWVSERARPGSSSHGKASTDPAGPGGGVGLGDEVLPHERGDRTPRGSAVPVDPERRPHHGPGPRPTPGPEQIEYRGRHRGSRSRDHLHERPRHVARGSRRPRSASARADFWRGSRSASRLSLCRMLPCPRAAPTGCARLRRPRRLVRGEDDRPHGLDARCAAASTRSARTLV